MAQANLPAHSPAMGHAMVRHTRLLALHSAHAVHRPIPAAPLAHAMARRAVETPVAASEPPTLRPLAMPVTATPFEQLRNHLSGSVVLRLEVDGDGRVRTAAINQSSGDAVLDAHALRMVRDWRFAVPADHPAGISGELPMRFDSVDQLAGTR
jgi:protein TonB